MPLSHLEQAPLRDAAYVGALLGIPPKTVLQYAREGRLPSIKLGKHRRFVIEDVERAIFSSRPAPPDPRIP